MAKKKPGGRDRTRSRPLTLAVLEQYGAFSGFVVPTGDFDPDGTWKHPYRLWLVASGGLALKPADVHYRGFLEIERKPSARGEWIALCVRQSIVQQTPGVHQTEATVQCLNNELASPRSWNLTHTVFDARLEPVQAAVRQTGTVLGDSIRIDYGGDRGVRTLAPAGPLTSNWSLFDAVQRVARKETPPLAFDMLDGLDQLKRAHQIRYRGMSRHNLNGKAVALHHYQHTGRGILPMNYYTDQQGRLLAALGGLRAYILDDRVAELHQQCLASMAGRAKP